jgi:hypothetical protein
MTNVIEIIRLIKIKCASPNLSPKSGDKFVCGTCVKQIGSRILIIFVRNKNHIPFSKCRINNTVNPASPIYIFFGLKPKCFFICFVGNKMNSDYKPQAELKEPCSRFKASGLMTDLIATLLYTLVLSETWMS